VVAVAAGYYHSLALKGDGTVMAWGWNGVGQLGDGTNQRRLTPAVVPGMNGVISISSGLFHNLALREDGTAWAWGYNGQGQVGDGTTVDRHVPVQLPPNYFNYAYAAVSAGWLHSVSVSDQWEMHSWGWNAVGQVAPPGGGDIPTPDTYLGSAMTISAGGYHNLNVQRDGSVHGNGWNGFGQLGPPGGLSNLTHVSSISAAGLHSLAVTSDGGLWTWGWNNFGQLGTGTTVSGPTPTLVSSMPNVATAVGGAYHSVATRR
jgi:alpha-tubulin suppressor-like RCC1 family protein